MLKITTYAATVIGLGLHLVTLAYSRTPTHPLPQGVETADITPGQHGGRFVTADSTEPKTFNPYAEADRTTSNILAKMAGSLISYDYLTQENVPGLAYKWELSQDKNTYTFYLRQGIQWSDGTPFTAADVIFTLDALYTPKKDPNTGDIIIGDNGQPELLYAIRDAYDLMIDGIPPRYRAIDDYTVEFITPRNYSLFLEQIGGRTILPKHKFATAVADGSFISAWNFSTAINNPQEIISLGPFRLKEYRPSERLVMEANPHYYRADSAGQRLPYIDEYIIKFVSDPATTKLLFLSGETEGLGVSALDVAWMTDKAQEKGFRIIEKGKDPGLSTIWLNQNPGQNEEGIPYIEPHKFKWFSNKNFRKALYHGFDRPGLAQGVYLGKAIPQRSVISEGNAKWFNPEIEGYPFDPVTARQLLEQEGFVLRDKQLYDSDGNPVEFDFLLTNSSPTWGAIVTVLQENLKEHLGITLNIKTVDWGVVIKKITHSFDYDASIIGWGSNSASDPHGSKALYMSSGAYHFWNPKQKEPATAWEKEVDELINQQEITFDTAKRIQIFHRIQEIFQEEVPIFPLMTPLEYVAISQRWHNLKIPPSGKPFWNIDEIWCTPNTP